MQTKRRRCAFLSMRDLSGFCCYDQLAEEPMRQLGWDVQQIAWDAEGVEWNDYELVVIRSPWDYQHRWQQFLAVLTAIDRSSARLENALEVVRWNVHKSYLRDLQQRGVKIVPTRWLDRLEPQVLDLLREQFGADQLVVKPLVGANADHTFRLPRVGAGQDLQRALDCFAQESVMVQPFVPAVVDEGEYSLFFFAGQFSHAVRKTPKSGDFRVQEEHGGDIQSTNVSTQLRAAGQAALDAVPWPLLYARVDLVRLADGTPALMELELIEPSLYFPYHPQAAERFAQAVQQLCG